MKSLVESNFKLLSWQKVVIDYVGQQHFDFLNNDFMDSFSDYERNKAAKIQISLPRHSGHTTLAAFLATHSPCVLIYRDTAHFKELEQKAKEMEEYFVNPNDENICSLGFHCDTFCISSYQIYHDLSLNDKTVLELTLEKFGNVASDPKMVIVDQAEELKENNPEIIDWIYKVSTGPIVLLG